MTTDFRALSPSAQAIKAAALAMYADCNVRKLAWPLDMPVVVASLRAAAEELSFSLGIGDPIINEHDLLAIATELEQHP